MKALGRIAGAVLLLAIVVGGAFYWNPLWFNDQFIRYHLWRSAVRSEYIEAGGHRIHYFEAVPPDGSAGKPLILVHGLGSRGEDWAAMMPGLAAGGFHVYAPDLLGFGRSEKPDGPCCSISLEEEVVVDTMHALGLTRADCDGWSMGGWIAAKIALEHPEMVDRLVVDNSAGLTFQPAFARDAFVPSDAAGLARLMAFLSPHPAKLPPFVVRATLRAIARNGRTIQTTMDAMEAGPDLLDTRMGGITQPTLIIWGMEDKLIPVAVGETMHREIAGSVFDGIVGCGHLAPNECAKPVLTGTIQFLKAQPPMQRGEQMLPATPFLQSLVALPHIRARLGQADVDEHAIDKLARHLGGVFGQVVKRGNDREDGRAGVGCELHVAQMDAVERRLADAEDQRATLLHADVGGALDEVRGHSVGDAGKRAHRARQDDHSAGAVTAAGDAGADVGLAVLDDFAASCAQQLLEQAVAAVELHLLGEDAQGRFGWDEINLGDAGVGLEGAEHLDGKNGAAGAGDGKGEFEAGRSGFGWTSHESDYRRLGLAFDDCGRSRDAHGGFYGYLAGVHAEEAKHRQTHAVGYQDPKRERRKHGTHEHYPITQRKNPPGRFVAISRTNGTRPAKPDSLLQEFNRSEGLFRKVPGICIND